MNICKLRFMQTVQMKGNSGSISRKILVQSCFLQMCCRFSQSLEAASVSGIYLILKQRLTAILSALGNASETLSARR